MSSTSMSDKSKNESDNSDLYTLTKRLHTLLPQELRDMIYAYFITPQLIYKICDTSSRRLDRFPYKRGHEPPEYRTCEPILAESLTQLHVLANPERVYVGFAQEISRIVYEQYREMWIDMPSAIPRFLETDFFGSGCTPRHVRLSKLHVSGVLDRGFDNSVNTRTLASDFAALLDCAWTQGFVLDIVFRSELGMGEYHRRNLLRLVKAMWRVWSTMQPFISSAESKGAKVNLWMFTTDCKTYGYRDGVAIMPDSENALLYEMELVLLHSVKFWFWLETPRKYHHVCIRPEKVEIGAFETLFESRRDRMKRWAENKRRRCLWGMRHLLR